MKKIEPFFPLNAGIQPGDLKSLLVPSVIYVAACLVLRILGWALGWVPLVGGLLNLVFSLVGLYCAIGFILAVIRYVRK